MNLATIQFTDLGEAGGLHIPPRFFVQAAWLYRFSYGPYSRLYVKRLVRQDGTGAWFLVGYDLR